MGQSYLVLSSVHICRQPTGEQPIADNRPVTIPYASGQARRFFPESLWKLVIVLAAIGGLIYLLRYALLPFAIGGALTLVLQPPLRWLMHRGHFPRWLAAIVVFGAVLAIVGGAMYWLCNILWSDFGRLTQNVPITLRSNLETILGRGDHEFFGHRTNAAELAQKVTEALAQYVQTPRDLLLVVAGGFTAAMGLFLTLLITFYGLLTGPRMAKGLLGLIPPAHRPAATHFAVELAPIVRRYIIGVIEVIALTAALAWVALAWVLRLPHSVFLSIVVGFLECIPVAGPALAIVLVSLVAVAEGSAWTILGVAIFFLCLRLLIDQVVGPLVLGQAVTLHPVTVLFALLCGMILYGPLGVIFAVPVAAAGKLALSHYYATLERTPGDAERAARSHAM